MCGAWHVHLSIVPGHVETLGLRLTCRHSPASAAALVASPHACGTVSAVTLLHAQHTLRAHASVCTHACMHACVVCAHLPMSRLCLAPVCTSCACHYPNTPPAPLSMPAGLTSRPACHLRPGCQLGPQAAASCPRLCRLPGATWGAAARAVPHGRPAAVRCGWARVRGQCARPGEWWAAASAGGGCWRRCSHSALVHGVHGQRGARRLGCLCSAHVRTCGLAKGRHPPPFRCTACCAAAVLSCISPIGQHL